ncbi:voltage-gated chloride channel protein, partial [Enterococcus faecalis]
MKKETKQLLSIGGYMAIWLLISAIFGFFLGALSAFFLKSLTFVTDVRLANPWLLFIIPISGVVFTYFYKSFGKKASRGNNLVIEQVNGGE